MSKSDDDTRAELSVEFRIQRSKRILQQLMAVQGLWLEGLSVTLIAERIGTSRDRVYWVLRALELVDRRIKRVMRPSNTMHLYALRVPGIEEACRVG